MRPDLTDAEWDYIKRIVCKIASIYDDPLANSIRDKFWQAETQGATRESRPEPTEAAASDNPKGA